MTNGKGTLLVTKFTIFGADGTELVVWFKKNRSDEWSLVARRPDGGKFDVSEFEGMGYFDDWQDSVAKLDRFRVSNIIWYDKSKYGSGSWEALLGLEMIASGEAPDDDERFRILQRLGAARGEQPAEPRPRKLRSEAPPKEILPRELPEKHLVEVMASEAQCGRETILYALVKPAFVRKRTLDRIKSVLEKHGYSIGYFEVRRAG